MLFCVHVFVVGCVTVDAEIFVKSVPRLAVYSEIFVTTPWCKLKPRFAPLKLKLWRKRLKTTSDKKKIDPVWIQIYNIKFYRGVGGGGEADNKQRAARHVSLRTYTAETAVTGHGRQGAVWPLQTTAETESESLSQVRCYTLFSMHDCLIEIAVGL